MSVRRIIPDEVRRRQAAASDPGAAAFVAANAGSGKTHVLAQRVIRLMLQGGSGGVDPSRILCITFTKAAAANMAVRVFDTLRSWIALDDAELDAAMRDIGVTTIDAATRMRARTLFAAALEVPGGLKVQTIHAFCTRILQQFPFEADVAARFTVLEERVQSEMLERATLDVLLRGAAAPASEVGQALKVAVAAAADSTFREIVREATAKRHDFGRWIEGAGSVTGALAQLSATLGIAADDTLAACERDIVEGPLLPSSQWAEMATVLSGSPSKNDKDQGERLWRALEQVGREQVENYLSVFFTGSNGPRKSLLTNSPAARRPELAQRLADEQARIVGLDARRKAIICRDRTAALVTIAVEVIVRYRDEKDRRGLVDYDDLIDKTLRLLSAAPPGWVHYKLDLGLDHVLIDEAQDTSEKQWEIIKRLTAEFAAGAGARGLIKRTVFAVGDEKQSIFSFQGAAPREYDAALRYFKKQYELSEVAWRVVRFDHSFRSGENVLGAVDEVFRPAAVYRSITSDPGGMLAHQALPHAVPGHVEIWPLMEPDPSPDMEAWTAPFDAVLETSAPVKLAQKIAKTVRQMINGGTPIGADRRRVSAGDVLVLVRQRGTLFTALIRALKNAGVEVAGADRMTLTEHIAVIDLMMLADALLLPDDDLALAIALKSPLFGLDDDQLFKLAHGRRASLRASLAAHDATVAACAQADALLKRCAVRARHDTPFAFFAWLLGPEHGRRKIYARLGLEAADALDEFLEMALAYERQETPSLQGFLAWLRAADTLVKRDMEVARDEVRVMTVHGAKGLEAPVVILADTTTPPRGTHPPRLLMVPRPKAKPGAPPCIVWAGRSADDVAAVAAARTAVLEEYEHEHRRLLYVAMTRAAERLIVCGYEGKKARPTGCWYNLVRDALVGKPECEEIGDGDAKIWRYVRRALPAEQLTFALSHGTTPLEVPAWLTAPVAAQAAGPVLLSPSQAYDDEHPPLKGEGRTAAGGPGWGDSGAISPASHSLNRPHPRPAAAAADLPPPGGGEAREARAKAMLRGTLLHRLMQALPEIAPERRETAARAFLERNAAPLDVAERERIAGRVLALLADPQFAQLFAAGSRAEVPVVGRLRRAGRPDIIVSGQIDRLAVTAEAVLIADYKTNRLPPQAGEAPPPAYVQQLALYRAVLSHLYADRAIRAALIWTEIPAVMEIPAAALDEAFCPRHLHVTAP